MGATADGTAGSLRPEWFLSLLRLGRQANTLTPQAASPRHSMTRLRRLTLTAAAGALVVCTATL